MAIKYSDYNFYEVTQHFLPNTSMLNLFTLLYDDINKQHLLNIFRNYIINEDAQNNLVYFLSHEVDGSEFPDSISYQYYGTPMLWWVIGLFNNITNPFEEFTEGDFLKILRPQYLYQLLREISIIGNS
jgi:hypothetical protein